MSQSIFTVHKYYIPFEEYGVPIYFIPVGDIHWGAVNHHSEKFTEFCEWGFKKQRAYYLGMGDYTDAVSHTEKQNLRLAKLHDTTVDALERWWKRDINDFLAKTKFMRGRTIGVLEGNHYVLFEDGTSSTQIIANRLGTRYLGGASLIRLILRSEGQHDSGTVDIFAAHGRRAAKLLGASINQVVDLERIAKADVYCLAHDHKKSIAMATTLGLKGDRRAVRSVPYKKVYVRTGGFQGSYIPDSKDYCANNLLRPNDIGVIKIELTPKRTRGIGFHIDIHASL